MRIVRRRSAELIIRCARANRAIEQVLHHAPTPGVTDDDEQLLAFAVLAAVIVVAVAPVLVMIPPAMILIAPGETDESAMMIGAFRLIRVRLEGAQHRDIAIEPQPLGLPIPDEAVHAIAEWLRRARAKSRIRIADFRRHRGIGPD